MDHIWLLHNEAFAYLLFEFIDQPCHFRVVWRLRPQFRKCFKQSLIHSHEETLTPSSENRDLQSKLRHQSFLSRRTIVRAPEPIFSQFSCSKVILENGADGMTRDINGLNLKRCEINRFALRIQ